MELTVLEVPDCPNAPLLAERLANLTAGRADVTLTRHIVIDEADAVRLGMRGSPTLLIDGTDPFPVPGASPALACRFYRSEDGLADRAPSVSALREALGQAGQRA